MVIYARCHNSHGQWHVTKLPHETDQ